jgi:hypothetical protein
MAVGDLVERRLELPGIAVDREVVHHAIVHHDRQAVNEALRGDGLRLKEAGRFAVCAIAAPDGNAVATADSPAECRNSRFVNMDESP